MPETIVCIFNPEHDLCLANGSIHYVPPESAIAFAIRDAAIMQALYPNATCLSVYDKGLEAALQYCEVLHVWGWDAVVRHELLQHGVPTNLIPSAEEVATIRQLQHRATILPLQPDCCVINSDLEMNALLERNDRWVLKAPWSGAGHGLRWIDGRMTDLDNSWLKRQLAHQGCVIAEPFRHVAANVALEYHIGTSGDNEQQRQLVFKGYSCFVTHRGVYKENYMWSDNEIADRFAKTDLQAVRQQVERWLCNHIMERYLGPLGVDLMVCDDNSVHVGEINFRHTMGMVAHEKIKERIKLL